MFLLKVSIPDQTSHVRVQDKMLRSSGLDNDKHIFLPEGFILNKIEHD
jgi:hypothetical protein